MKKKIYKKSDLIIKFKNVYNENDGAISNMIKSYSNKHAKFIENEEDTVPEVIIFYISKYKKFVKIFTFCF